ncbi:rod shape-determining protein MreC [Erythrobacter sp. F6033]|uniref:rod shape-determining protein MreC n=1 Tax=Erythrobacter sp. F6033 TaxID=2926401 RepID=UPI001FF410F4|nr:rod shape-determining protein MreC [Erythrobacter sp. F6033]MCK0128443.1 rod shape-determining protein MreC [Erythrobacter sp. F6033]
MAPPSSRRTSGFSKKAQYSVFTGYLLAGLGALLGLGLLALSLWQPAALAPLRGGTQDAVTTVGEGPAAVRSSSKSTWNNIKGYFYAGSQNAALREEVELARIRLAEAEAVAQENERLKSLVALAESEIEPVAVTRLVGSSSTSSRRFAYIGKGRLQGVEVGMPVRSPRGVVGRVLEVARSSSRILLLTDSESVLPVRRSSDDTVAFAEGRGDGMVRIRLINLGLNPLEVGDIFVTSGAGGYYRPGVAVAVLTELTPDGGIARLVAAPSATDFVSVEPTYVPEAVEALETRPEDSINPSEDEN